ncbi:MAG: MoaD family protein [bacterium]|jgi:molybdopterin synthase sulfur carrier subunit|nr:MoaD/ThiS family protein [Bacillota bacterium]
MKVKFLSDIRDCAGVREETLKFSGTVGELLLHLSHKYGNTFRKTVLTGDQVSDRIVILVNGRNIAYLNGTDTVLGEEDEVSIFPVLSGG